MANALGIAPDELPEDVRLGVEHPRDPFDHEYSRPEPPAAPAASPQPRTAPDSPNPAPSGREDRYAAERSATKWSEAHDLPKHDPRRPSQQPAGAHRRHVRAKAARLGVTDSVADSRMGGDHPGPDGPGTCEWRVERG
jgi:hypothetical protein